MDKLYQTRDADLLACHISNFPLVSFTNRASDTFREVMADIKAGYDESIHPKLFELYKDNYHKGLSMFGESEPGSMYFELHEKFKLNTARLASYKSYKVTKLLKDLPEKDFDKNALQVLKNFNRYQATEYNAIVARARSAKQFIDFQQDADLYPNMEWIMTRSANPREAHLALVGTIRPINDPFWNENQPGNLWNCKCDWQPTDKEVTGVPKQVVKPATGLDGNPAITRDLISDRHPYINKCSDKTSVEDFMYNWVQKETFTEVSSFENGGKALQHILLNTKDNDFKDLTIIADLFAKEGTVSQQLPKVNAKSKYYDYLFKGAYKRKCPDLRNDELFYEFESFKGKWNENKIRKMLSNGLKQSDNVIIDIRNGFATDAFIHKKIYAMKKEGVNIREIWVYENNGLRLVYKAKPH